MLQEGHTDDNYKDRGENRKQGFRNQSDDQLEYLELHQDLQAEIKKDVSIADHLVILPKSILRRTHLQEMCSIEKKE